MSNFKKSILIFIVFFGLLGPILDVQAVDPDGICTITNGRAQRVVKTTEADCKSSVPPGSWVPVTPAPTPKPAPLPALPACTYDAQNTALNTPCLHNGVVVNGPAFYHILAPFPCQTGEGCNKDGMLTDINPGAKNALGVYLNIMLKIFIGICSVLAVVMIVIGGIEYMTSELVSSKEAGKDRIVGALFGLVIALGSYALLNTINPDLLNTDIQVDQTIIAYEDQPQIPVNGKYTSDNQPYNAGEVWQPRSGIITPLPSWAKPINGECANVGDTNCTSIRGLQTAVLDSIHAGCNDCYLTITGGTEFWLHSTGTTHRPGSSTVDLMATKDLNSYITGSSGFPTNGGVTKKNNVCYLAEGAGQTANTTGSHWHAYQC